MKKLNIIAIILLATTIHQAAAMDTCCPCLKTLFGYSYNQKKIEYIKTLKKIENLNRQSINEILDPLSHDQVKHIKKFIEDNGIENTFPKLHPLISRAVYDKDLNETIQALSTPPTLVMRPMTIRNIQKGYHPGVLLMR